ncbi:hypothetical protein ES703_24427 [subsurface metagenome]
MIKSKRVNVFLGLNNQFNPASAEYREGMAWRSKNARIDESGVWVPRRLLTGCSSPPGTLVGWGSGNHFKNLAVENTDKIITGLATTECVAVGPNTFLYGTTGAGAVTRQKADGTKTSQAVYSGPGITSVAANDGESSRAENGTYYYIVTYFDDIYKRESAPSKVYHVEIDHDAGTKDYVTVTLSAAVPANTTARVYRSLRICAAEGIYNATNIFYFVGEIAAVATTLNDYLHDNDIRDTEFEGRGCVAPPTAVDHLAAYNNRMLYFKGNTMYWSSAGQPDDVAQDYELIFRNAADDGDISPAVECKPKLSLGVYGEAKYEIPELAGQKVLGSMLRDGKLWMWTASMTGYLKATNRLEGYRFKVVRKGIGIVSDKVLAHTPYGIFGADRQGIWLLDNADRIRRLSESSIDIYAGADTTLTEANITNSFGVWIPILNEYWWSVSNVQIVFQANRGIFAGPYTYSILGGTNFVSTGGAQAYLTGGQTPHKTSLDTGTTQYLDFWFGQSEPGDIKHKVKVEVVHPDATGDASVTLKQTAYTGDSAPTSGAAIAYNGSPIGKAVGIGSGRLFKVELTTSSGRKTTGINYKYDVVEE